jgi:hypothetical protein
MVKVYRIILQIFLNQVVMLGVNLCDPGILVKYKDGMTRSKIMNSVVEGA